MSLATGELITTEALQKNILTPEESSIILGYLRIVDATGDVVLLANLGTAQKREQDLFQFARIAVDLYTRLNETHQNSPITKIIGILISTLANSGNEDGLKKPESTPKNEAILVAALEVMIMKLSTGDIRFSVFAKDSSIRNPDLTHVTLEIIHDGKKVHSQLVGQNEKPHNNVVHVKPHVLLEEADSNQPEVCFEVYLTDAVGAQVKQGDFYIGGENSILNTTKALMLTT